MNASEVHPPIGRISHDATQMIREAVRDEIDRIERSGQVLKYLRYDAACTLT
eukprot:COSAG06_NODE_1985_length_7908_cov_11.907671_2_plen_52_part_00